MKPYYQDDAVQIFHGDCREILPGIEPVDLVLTDPPYGIGYSRYESHDDDEKSYWLWMWPTLELAEEKLIDKWMVVFQAEKTCRQWAERFPREWHLFALPKTFGQIGREPISRQTDYALYWRIGNPIWPIVRASEQFFRNWFLSRQASATCLRPDHPCPRPIDMMNYLVACFCPPMGTILDPFMGSGTTLRAAKDLGRKAIGIEIEEKYCEIAARRMAQEVLQLCL